MDAYPQNWDTFFNIIVIVYAMISIIGMAGNSIIVFSTYKTKTMHQACNILIAACALSDIFHQLGHFPLLIWRDKPLPPAMLRNILAFPLFFVNTGTMLLLTIAGDRIIAIMWPVRYSKFARIRYITIALTPSICFASILTLIQFTYTSDDSTLIFISAGYSGIGLVVWQKANLVLYGSVAVSYFLLFAIVKMHFNSTNAARQFTRRILRSLCVTACCVVCGQLTTVLAGPVASALGATGVQMLYVQLIGGLGINISIGCQFFVYYFCSHEYRLAFRRHVFRRICSFCKDAGSPHHRSKINTITVQMKKIENLY